MQKKLDQLICVDTSDRVLGYADREICHAGRGILHRAVSVMIVNEEGQILLQRRSANKSLWPLYWSISCCGHPVRGESYQVAAERRVFEELDLRIACRHLFTFRYSAQFGATASEREICSVFWGRTRSDPVPDAQEICDWRFVDAERISDEIIEAPDRFTPWFLLEWKRIIRWRDLHRSARCNNA
jgi:isopentenyl-diphosphate delta-isomerase